MKNSTRLFIKTKCFFGILAWTLFFCGIFTSCDNFLMGTDLMDGITSTIDYANAPSYKIRVAAEEGTGTIITGGGDKDFKVTDTFTVSFQKSVGYKFIKWQAVQKNDETKSMNSYVEFEDETAFETNVKFIKASNDIKIQPLCEQSLAFIEKFPIDTEDGVPRDSTIKLVLSSPLAQDNDYSKIIIQVDGSDADARLNFETPEITVDQENALIIAANTKNRIEVEEGKLRTVRVTIPADFKYVGKNGPLEIGEELSHSYKINSSTSNLTLITFGTNCEDSGKIRIDGLTADSVTQRYSIGKYLLIAYKVNSGFKFNGWNINDNGAIAKLELEGEEFENCDENGFDAEKQTAYMKIRIINYSENVNIIAQAEKIPDTEIQITSAYGKISPNGLGKYMEGDKVNLFFTADSDYQFIRWRLVNKKTGEEIENQDYVRFENDNEFNTNFVLEKVDANIDYLIEPYCELRPKVVSVSPLYDSDGVYRDRRIIVMFDTYMDTSSIYYSKEELVKLNILSESEDLDSTDLESGYTILKDSSNNCYGYWDSQDKNSYHYKNVQITKRKNLNENLLQYYEAPCFDENDTSKIIIKSNTNNPPPAGTEILVTIGSEICSSVESLERKTNILLGSKYKWSFYTNGREDSDPPIFNKIDVRFADANQSSYNGSAKEVSNSIENITEFPKIKLPEYNHKPKNLWLKGDFTDNGSGPASLKWSITKINNKYYPIAHDLEYLSGQIEGDDYAKTGNTVMIGKGSSSESKGILIDYSSIKDEGLYRFSVTAADNNGCTTTKNYYFVYDETPPANVSSVSNSRKSAEKETLNWTNPAAADYAHIEIKQYDGEILNNTFTQDSTSVKTADFAGLIDQHKYRYEIKTVDYCGNESTIKTYQDDTPPSKFKIRYSEGRNGRVNVFFTTPNEEDYAYTKIRYGSTDGWEEILGEANGRNISSYASFGNATNWTLYNYYFRTYDYSGNCSDFVYLQEMAGAEPGMICYAPGNSPDNIFCSKNYWPGMNPIGIVADGSNQSKVKILASDESQSYTYGLGHSNFCADNAWQQYRWDIYVANGAIAYYNCQDGLKWYETVRDMPDYMDNAIGTNDQYGTWHDSIWTYAKNKNKNSAVTWWIPARHEWQYVCWNWKTMCTARDVLKNNNESFANMSNNTKYYVATPNYYTSSCNMIGINYNDNGNLNEYLANGEWMNMYTTSYKRDAYARNGYYGAYVRCMAFIDMN